AREPVREKPFRSESALCLGCRYRGELPQRPDPQPDEQLGKLGFAKNGDGARCEKGLHRWWHDHHGSGGQRIPRRQQRGEHPVGDSNSTFETEPLDGLGDLTRECCLAAEVPGGPASAERANAWPEHLDPRAELSHRGNDLLECARFKPRFDRLADWPTDWPTATWRLLRRRPARTANNKYPMLPAHPTPTETSERLTSERPIPENPMSENPISGYLTLRRSDVTGSSAWATVPSGPGSHNQRARARDHSPRPSATTRTLR